ncbi:phage minor tail protein L [uncultured Mediterranean phage uvMED]|nr:phage minor tail protein L [uncultured Mediterranean phage uvMED]
MSRSLTGPMASVTTDSVVRPAYFVKMTFDSNDNPALLNVWSGVGSITYDSDTYTGVGDLLSISEIVESADISAAGINVSITGIKSEFLAIAKNHQYQGRPLSVALGAFNNTGSLISSPVVMFSGFMDTMIISENDKTSTIKISVENKLIAFERSKVRRYTAEDQKIDHPTDKGFEYVTAIVEKEILWGRPTGTAQGGGNNGHQGGAGNNNIGDIA